MRYGITKPDLQIIDDACRVSDIEADWLKEEIFNPCQLKRNSGAEIDVNAAYKIIKSALNKL